MQRRMALLAELAEAERLAADDRRALDVQRRIIAKLEANGWPQPIIHSRAVLDEIESSRQRHLSDVARILGALVELRTELGEPRNL
jgi:hypothetical protein